MLTLKQLLAIMPDAGGRAALYLPHLNTAMARFQINTEQRIEMFLATLAHESGDLLRMQEGLNYSAVSLMKTWPTRFTSLELANQYARQPEKIANFVYANRGGNGDAKSGDGWRYRGAGLIQLTFKDNHAQCGKYFKIDVKDMPNWLITPEGACMSAAWFWSTRGCNAYADRGDFDGTQDLVNRGRKTEKIGDAIGFEHRLADLKIAQGVIDGQTA